MTSRTPADDLRAARRVARKEAVLAAAWDVAREQGLAAVSLHEVARRVGLRQPSLYVYVDSKAGLYDAMFAEAARELLGMVTAGPVPSSPRGAVAEATRRIVRFSAGRGADTARFQLLFLRTVPGFEPSPESYALSVQLWEWLAERLRDAGLRDPADVDLYTALVAGLLVQQTSNEPGGDRWTRHLDTVLAMFFEHVDRGPSAGSGRAQEEPS